jgi:rhodanese-related sulfurtransferase/uncharacterized OsmC-like protein
MTGVMEMVAAARAGIENLTPAEVADEADRGDVLLVDLREPHETANGVIPGALSAPRGMLEFHADPATPYHLDGFDPGRRVIVYCASGSRSALAAKSLQDLGYGDVAHLAGGLTRWVDESRPLNAEPVAPSTTRRTPMTNTLRHALDTTASAVAGDPGLAAATFAAEGELVGVTEVDVRVGDRVVKVDQPESIGGSGLAPNPVEFALASLGSCQAHTYRFWSEKLGIRIDELRVDVQGRLDVRGVFGLEDGVRAGFGDVDVAVRISGPETAERYEELRRAVDEHCPVLDIFANPVPVCTSMSTPGS